MFFNGINRVWFLQMRYEESHHPSFIAPVGPWNHTGAVNRHGPTNRHAHTRQNERPLEFAHWMTLKWENRTLWGSHRGGQSVFLSPKGLLNSLGWWGLSETKGESGALERKYEPLRSMFGRPRAFKTVLIMHGLHQLSEPRGYLFTRSFIYSFKQQQWFEKPGLFNCDVADWNDPQCVEIQENCVTKNPPKIRIFLCWLAAKC